MKKIGIIIFWVCLCIKIFAQSNCINDSLLITTNDQEWKLISNSYGVTNGINASVIGFQYNSITGFPTASWMSYTTGWGINGVIGQPDDSAYFRFTFNTCRNDSVLLNFLFRRDGHCNLKLDGNYIFTEGTNYINTNNYDIGTQMYLKKYLLAGTHTIDFIIYNEYTYTGFNATGGIIGGYLVSDKSSLISNDPNCSNATCCGTSVFPITLSGDTNVCIGDAVNINAVSATNVSWYNTSNNTTTNGTSLNTNITTNTTFIVTGEVAGCSSSTTFTVHFYPKPNIIASKKNDIGCLQGYTSSQLSASGALSYSWSPSIGLNNSNIANPIASPSVTTTYILAAVNGCTVYDTITVYVTNNASNSIFVPNSFSPNNDGINDCLEIKHNIPVSDFLLIIYNRWGEKVFESTSVDKCWNGDYKYYFQTVDVFFYYLKANSACGIIEKKGDIMLIE